MQARPDDVFVGRALELAELQYGLEQAKRGIGALLQIVGEPGVGKSRLVRALAERAQAQGATVVTGRCWEGGGAPAYWPWVQVLRSVLRQQGQERTQSLTAAGAAALAAIAPELSLHGPTGLPLPDAEPERARFALFDAVTLLLRSAAKSQPLIVILENLHAADAPSLVLLRFLAQHLDDASL